MFFTDVIASRLKAAGMHPVTAIHRQREVVLLYFDAFRTDLATLIKGSGGCWSQTHGCWYLPSALLSQGPLLTKLGYPLPDYLQAELRRYTEALETNAYSKATIRNYTACLQPFLFHFREAAELGDLPDAQIRQYLMCLLRKGGLAESTVNMHINAIKFFYEAVYGQPREYHGLLRPKKRLQFLTVFTRDDVYRIISAILNLKHRAMVVITCATRLRLSELVGIRIKDIDNERMLLHVRQGKGKEDRQMALSSPVLEALRIFDALYKPRDFLFEGQEGGPYSVRSLQRIMHNAKMCSGIKREGSIQALRHSFATHFLSGSADLRLVKELLQP